MVVIAVLMYWVCFQTDAYSARIIRGVNHKYHSASKYDGAWGNVRGLNTFVVIRRPRGTNKVSYQVMLVPYDFSVIGAAS